MQIEITLETANAMVLIKDRYYFDLFKSIRNEVSEEYKMMDAIFSIAQEIQQQGEIK